LIIGDAQRPRLAAVLAFEKRRARQLKPIRITELEDNTIMKSIRVAPYKS
jgi:hypothetical protein